MKSVLRLALPLFVLATASACRSSTLAPRSAVPPSGSSSDAGPADDAYPRRSWHPVAPPPCQPTCAVPAPSAPPPVLVPTTPPRVVAAPPCAPPPCAPPRAEPYVAPPCAPPPCDTACVKMADSTCPLFTLRGRYWHAWATGDVYITRGGAAGTATTVDLADDMDLDAGNEWMVGADVRFGRHRVRAAYEPLAWDGKNTLDGPVVYHGVTYPAATTVKSDLKMKLYELGYQYALVDGCDDTIWGGASGWIWTFDGRMREPRIDESRSFTHIYPVLTLAGEHRFGNWKIGGGVNFGGLATDRFVVDLEAAVGVRLFGHLDLEAGWRWMRFDFHESTNKASMTFQGPFAGIAYEF